MKELNKQLLKQITTDLNEAIKPVAEKYGLQIKIDQTNFSLKNATTKLQIAVIEDGQAVTREVQDYLEHHQDLGLKLEWLNREFEVLGKKYFLLGLKTKSTKYPLLARSLDDGKTYKLPVRSVKFGFMDKQTEK